MTFETLSYISQHEAEEIQPKDNQIIISITSGWPPNLSNLWGKERILTLAFDDVEANTELLKYELFSKEQAVQIINWLVSFENTDKTDIIVHCFAGMSRSAAVAKFIADVYELEFNKNYELYNKIVYNILKDTQLCLKELSEDTIEKD